MESLSVLLIEDNESHRTLINRFLERTEGYKVSVDSASMLRSGIDKILNNHFDAVLLDLRLPDSEADNTLEKVLTASPEVPIVVLSSFEDREVVLRAVQEGAQEYLSKANLSSEVLIRAIKNAIERKRNETLLRQQIAQNSALYELSRFSLVQHNLSSIFEVIEDSISKVLKLDLVKIFDFNAETISYLGLLNVPTENVDTIWTVDVEADVDKTHGSYLVNQGCKSGINLIFSGRDENEKKILIAYSKRKTLFLQEHLNFIQSISNTLTAAIIRIRLESELKRRIRDLDNADRRKDEFLATLSHELRTPLNIISNSLENLRTLKSSDPHEYLELLDIVERNLKIEIRLISEVLDLSRIITGKMRLNISEFNLVDLLDSTQESIRETADFKNITLNISVNEDVGKIFADQDRIQQVLWNLISNAVKFTPRGGAIDIGARRSGSIIEIFVKDNGIGIAPESLNYVFNRFWQEDSSINRKYTGLGLGLGIVRHIVELHGGTVRVHSLGRDQGTEFVVTLPLKTGVSEKIGDINRIDKDDQISSINKSTQIEEGLKGLSIMLVDDSDDTLKLIQRILEKRGAQVFGYTSPNVAIEEFKKNPVNVLISDIGMPEIDGYELIQRVRKWEVAKHRPQTPAIALTAFVSDEDSKKALLAGYQMHIGKPVKSLDLQRDILQLVNGNKHNVGSELPV